MRRVLPLLFAAALAVSAQQVGRNKTAGPQETAAFQTTTQLVVETVTVKRAGKFVEGLTAQDFVVTEDGLPQEIRLFEVQTIPDGPGQPLAEIAGNQRSPVLDKLPKTRIAPEPWAVAMTWRSVW